MVKNLNAETKKKLARYYHVNILINILTRHGDGDEGGNQDFWTYWICDAC